MEKSPKTAAPAETAAAPVPGEVTVKLIHPAWWKDPERPGESKEFPPKTKLTVPREVCDMWEAAGIAMDIS